MTRCGALTTLAPEVLADLERMWTTTKLRPHMVANHLSRRHGVLLTGIQVRDHATRRGMLREAYTASVGPATETRLLAQAVARWDEKKVPPPDNPVRRVRPGTFPARGFRLGMGL